MRRWLLVLDVVVVVSFVAIGRDTHGFVSSVDETLRVAAPFLLALGFAIVVLRAWRSPTALLTGLYLSLTTLVLGMAMRGLVFDRGTARTFVVIAGVYLIGLMVGWRAVMLGVDELRLRRSSR